MTYWLNDRPFAHDSPNGVGVEASRCDLADGVIITRRSDHTEIDVATAIAAAMGFHGANILPRLNGFRGYDNIQYSVRDPSRDQQNPPSE